MKIIMYFTNAMIPLFLFIVLLKGMMAKIPLYDTFMDGARQGLQTVVKMIPTIIGLMVAVGVLRASGFFEWIQSVLQPVVRYLNLPAEMVPISIIRLFSSSAANGLLTDILKRYGADSRPGVMASIMLSSTEAVFYTMSIYFSSVGVKKVRWSMLGAVVSALTGVVASIIITNHMMFLF
ncbi:MAG: spore maturation protein [Lachnospiraceae bacterium]